MQKSCGLISILATLLLSASIIVAYNSGAYKRNRAAVADYPNWMRRLVDTTLVTETFPSGIRDTMKICKRGAESRDVCGSVPVLQDQSHSMTLQQRIRSVDIRCAYAEEAEIDVSHFIQFTKFFNEGEADRTFPPYCRPAYLGGNFEARVMDVINQFLPDNPTEIILGPQSVTYEHQYLNDGPDPRTSPTYDDTVEVIVTGEDGGAGSKSATATANNVDPTASIDSVTDELENQIGIGFKCASFVLVGLPLTGTFSFADAGTLDMHSAAVDWKDGSTVSFYDFPATTPFSEVHTYTTSGVFDVSLAVTNADTGTVEVSESIEVLESTEAVLRILEALRDLVVVTEEEQELIQNTTAALEGNVNDGFASVSGALHMLLKNNWSAAFTKIGEALTFMGMLDDLLEDDDLTACKSILVLAVKSVVMELFDDNSNGKPNFQKRAQDKIGEGDEAALAGSYEGAVIKYSEALHSLANA
jgi:PKD repeat protein